MKSKTPLRALVPDTGIRSLLAGGCAVLAVGFGGMTAWAALAPLHSAVVAVGSLAPDTGRKTVKHNEGGQIGEMLVREGDAVRAGQVMLRLDATEAETRLQMLQASWFDTLALEARLTAELFERDGIAWPAGLSSQRTANPAVATAMDNQQKLFSVRRGQLETEERLMQERIATLDEHIAGVNAQREYLQRELTLAAEDISITTGLLSRGNSTRTKLVEQEKEQARLQGRDKELQATIAQSKQQQVETRGEIVRRRNDFREKVLTDLEKARGDVQKLAEQMRDAANRLANRDVKAPDDGVVVMHSHLASGVSITPNEPIMDVIPAGRELLAEVHIQPKDIKSIAVDLPVKVQLTAYDTRIVGTLDGTVTYVSADRMTDPATRQDYFLARIRLKGEDSAGHNVGKLAIRAGMPVEARILLSERTPLDYLVTPLKQSYVKAFIQE